MKPLDSAHVDYGWSLHTCLLCVMDVISGISSCGSQMESLDLALVCPCVTQSLESVFVGHGWSLCTRLLQVTDGPFGLDPCGLL